MKSKTFAIEAIDLAQMCINKNIHFELDIDTRRYKSLLIIYFIKNVVAFYEEEQDRYIEYEVIKKLVEEYGG